MTYREAFRKITGRVMPETYASEFPPRKEAEAAWQANLAAGETLAPHGQLGELPTDPDDQRAFLAGVSHGLRLRCRGGDSAAEQAAKALAAADEADSPEQRRAVLMSLVRPRQVQPGA